MPGMWAIAPVRAVRGNVDRDAWCAELPETAVVRLGELSVLVLHDSYRLQVDPVTAGYAAVVYGHSHRPQLEEKDGVLYLNPGSAGPRRFRLPVSVARLQVAGSKLRAELVELKV